MMTLSCEYGAIVIQEKDLERMSNQLRDVDIATPRGICSNADGRSVDNLLVMTVMPTDMDHHHCIAFHLERTLRKSTRLCMISPFHQRVKSIEAPSCISASITICRWTASIDASDCI
eukprot:2527097-Amphidinium_carterae.1